MFIFKVVEMAVPTVWTYCLNMLELMVTGTNSNNVHLQSTPIRKYLSDRNLSKKGEKKYDHAFCPCTKICIPNHAHIMLDNQTFENGCGRWEYILLLYFQITLKTVLLPWAQWGKNALSNMQAKMLDISHLLKSNSFFQNFCQHF